MCPCLVGLPGWRMQTPSNPILEPLTVAFSEEGPMDHTLLDFFCNPSYRRPHCIENTYVHTYMFDYIEQVRARVRDCV